jgi:type II secretory pathway pseudopilin PulG
MRKQAFTICEVLIVLGILGLIAEMTLPSLINNVQETIWKTSAKVAYSKAAEAIQLMKIDEGGTLDYYVSTTLSFSPVFVNYYKILKNCAIPGDSNYNKCADLHSYKTLNGAKPYLGYIDDGHFITADGMFYAINNCYYHLAPNESAPTGCGPFIDIAIDVNGSKNPNTFGKDLFMFELRNDNLFPMGDEKTSFPASTYCNKNNSSIYQGFGCMYYVMQGIDY